jgi:hypothetical protein
VQLLVGDGVGQRAEGLEPALGGEAAGAGAQDDRPEAAIGAGQLPGRGGGG